MFRAASLASGKVPCVPVSQAHALPDAEVIILKDIGHTLYEEASDVVRDTILKQAQR